MNLVGLSNQASRTRKQFMQYVSLAMLSMMGQSLFIFADTFFIANGVGSRGIAALNIVLPMVNVFNGIGWMFGIGGATLFAIALGKKQFADANRLFNMTFMFTISAAIAFAAMTSLFSEPILRFLGANEGTYSLAKSYYDILMFFSPLFMVNFVFISFLRNDNNPRLAMIAMLTGGLVNIVLDYIFIFPLQMELKGAAIATVFSPLTSILVATLHWRRADHHLHFNKVSMQIKKLKDIVSLGFSSFFNEFSSAVVMFLFNIVLLELVGNIAVSAYAIIANINIIVIALFTGLGQGFQPLASKFLGQGNSKELKHVLKLALIAAVFLSLIIFGIGFFFPDGLVAIFNSEQNQEMALIALQGIPLYFMSFVFTGMNFVVIYYLAAINQARSSLILSALRGFVLIIPVLLMMALWFDLIGVWLTMMIVEVMTFIFALYILRKSLSRLV